MSTQYTLTVENNSTQSGDFCIFQEVPDINKPNIITLAWLSKAANPTTTLVFDWSLQYNFIWTNSTNLQPGDSVTTSQSWDCDVNTSNRIVLDKTNNAYTFSNQSQGDFAGNLYIDETQRVSSNEASVGIGMAGKGTFLVSCQPNMQIVMTPKPTYWIAFGSFKEGDVLDVGLVTQNACKLQYKGVTAMSVALGADNCWTTSS
jgi:hypothetical protein